MERKREGFGFAANNYISGDLSWIRIYYRRL